LFGAQVISQESLVDIDNLSMMLSFVCGRIVIWAEFPSVSNVPLVRNLHFSSHTFFFQPVSSVCVEIFIFF
jgi:hypothetical protein